MRLLQYITLIIMVVAATVAMGQDRKTIFWEDRGIAQLEKMTPELLTAIGRLQGQIQSIALSTIRIDENLTPRLRRILIARIYEIMTTGPLNMVKCENCSQVRTELVGSILKIGRGIADDDFRRAKAKELNVQGFLDLDVFMSGTQLSITMTAYEAEGGKVIFSEIIAGNPPGPVEYLHGYLGKFIIPVTYTGTTIDQQAFIFGGEFTNRLSETWKYSAGVGLLVDDTSATVTATVTGAVAITGIMVDGLVSWDAFTPLGGRLKVSLNFGLGQMLGDNLGSPSFIKPGFAVSVGDRLTINYNLITFTTASTTPVSSGGSYLALGWQF